MSVLKKIGRALVPENHEKGMPRSTYMNKLCPSSGLPTDLVREGRTNPNLNPAQFSSAPTPYDTEAT